MFAINRERSYEVTWLGVDRDGVLDLEHLRAAFDPTQLSLHHARQ
jgi:cysteine sulfinate desulfinase/cysteine desulfurase-like protein